jgi:hypothetical protein
VFDGYRGLSTKNLTQKRCTAGKVGATGFLQTNLDEERPISLQFQE